jgi:proteasome lid subunit RPN8/RPN11
MTPERALVLMPETMDEILAHAREDYPSECCGVVTEDRAGGRQVHRCQNIQDRLHASDPETHPRTSREAYRMDDMQLYRILSSTEEADGRLIAFYHSHIDCDAYFSEEDQTAATSMGEPAYPDAAHLVIPVIHGEIGRGKAFRWDGETKAFPEIPVRTGGAVSRGP